MRCDMKKKIIYEAPEITVTHFTEAVRLENGSEVINMPEIRLADWLVG